MVEKENGNRLLMDAYNANPSSMRVAIEAFKEIEAPNKILILGDMKELGSYSEEEHQQLVNELCSYPWKAVFLVGENFGKVQTNYLKFPTIEELNLYLQKEAFKQTIFLVKGSRSMTLEKIKI